jgi:hypothetical protein
MTEAAASTASGAAGGATTGAAAGPWGALVGAGVGGAMGLAGGLMSDSDPGTLHLTPEYEVAMLDYFQQAMSYNDYLLQQNADMQSIYNSRMSSVEQYMKGMLPSSQVMQQLQKSTMQIASRYGMDAMKAMQSGFLDEQTARMSGLIEDREGQMFNANQEDLDALKTVESADYTDPRVENQINDQRRQLEQELQRSGVGPAQRQIALRQFENQANEMRFSTRQTAITETTQRAATKIASRMGMLSGSSSALGQASSIYLSGRQEIFNEAMQGYQAAMGGLQYGQSAIAGLGGLYGTQAGMNQQFLGNQRQLNSDSAAYFAQLGQYDLSKATRQAVQTGIVGPGSYYSQTGQSRQSIDDYAHYAIGQETNAAMYGGSTNTSLQSYQATRQNQYGMQTAGTTPWAPTYYTPQSGAGSSYSRPNGMPPNYRPAMSENYATQKFYNTKLG